MTTPDAVRIHAANTELGSLLAGLQDARDKANVIHAKIADLKQQIWDLETEQHNAARAVTSARTNVLNFLGVNE